MMVVKNDIEFNGPVIDIVPMEKKHVFMLCQRIREADVSEIQAIGFTPYKAILKSYRYSLVPKTAFIDGNIAACWGVCGSPLHEIGQPWLMTTDQVYKISPLKFAKIYQREVRRMLRIFSKLENYVDSKYPSAVRLLDIIGFTIEPAEPYLNGAMFHKFWKRS